MYQIAVVLIVALHLVFVGYVVAGGFLALRWRRTIWLHVPAVLWAVLILTAHLDCPLTWLERRARTAAGMASLPPEGFIAHYLTGVLYPATWVAAVEGAVLAAVGCSWVLYRRAALRRRRYGGAHAGADHRRRAERLL
ncbi:hypothetical protein MTER_20370 [Mycolicibacter terrae]|uniref:DUF2784 domain-containing protein n=1 Tax=Mycolicibacter terrae TaxID=1788 RepID=A0AAD1HXV1_9MYCO|nr:DUF2784 domain-containing protein [Mycolicibacter terrae]ORW97627.1 hypothetical protein AWC28_08845 [Mycolicibacter terrae]BBX22626.1 hypothetical protein MTER_20370 [Mycolicibacter terrae]SNV73525.1 Protein of Uncharacterised function (DUF2784) [Mycolicibacter terrae]